MEPTDINSEIPRVKRKYTKRAKMLLRSNNDYIDHTYWPKMYAKSKKKHENMMKKYGIKSLDNAEPHVWTDTERRDLDKMGINKHYTIISIPDAPLTRIVLEED